MVLEFRTAARALVVDILVPTEIRHIAVAHPIEFLVAQPFLAVVSLHEVPIGTQENRPFCPIDLARLDDLHSGESIRESEPMDNGSGVFTPKNNA